MDARQIIETLGLQPHPEGGWYVQTMRDAPHGGRGHSTLIYFLLERGQTSDWHRVHDAVEVWHYYSGASLTLTICEDEGKPNAITLGANLHEGQRPQGVVPANWWQMAVSNGDWTLVGCTVSPGFEFEKFELAPTGWSP